MADGLYAATTDPGTLARWWDRWPTANVAVRTGAVSGLIVVDIDVAHGGEDTLADLTARHGALPAGRVVRTGGGRHLYLAHPGGLVRNDTGRRLGPGVDVRGDGGYVLAPPSLHHTGVVYGVVGLPREIPPPPGWLLARLEPPRRTPSHPPGPVHDVDGWARAALRGELDGVLAAPEGTRNDTLNRAAYRLGQLVAAGHLDEDDTGHRLLSAAMAVGLTQREATATIGSGLDAGADRPRGPQPRPPMTRASGPGRCLA